MSNVSRADRRPMTTRDFLGFYEKQPDAVHWELIDGTPYMMTPPTIAHQFVASNLEIALRMLVRGQGLALRVAREIGIELPGRDDFRPEPEVTVIDAGADVGRSHASRFFLVAEVLSPSDRRTIGRKLDFYRAHADCHTVILVRPDECRVEVHARTSASWVKTVLSSLDDTVVVAPWGPLCTLRALYDGTPLAP